MSANDASPWPGAPHAPVFRIRETKYTRHAGEKLIFARMQNAVCAGNVEQAFKNRALKFWFALQEVRNLRCVNLIASDVLAAHLENAADMAKLVEARTAAFGTAVRFDVVTADWSPPLQPTWDAIVLVDVLYLMGTGAGAALLATAAAAIRPGGRIVIKEIAMQPRWKYRLAVAQERAATSAAVTAGAAVDFLAPRQIVTVLEAAGMVVTTRSIDRGYPHPHLLVLGDRPAER